MQKLKAHKPSQTSQMKAYLSNAVTTQKKTSLAVRHLSVKGKVLVLQCNASQNKRGGAPKRWIPKQTQDAGVLSPRRPFSNESCLCTMEQVVRSRRCLGVCGKCSIGCLGYYKRDHEGKRTSKLNLVCFMKTAAKLVLGMRAKPLKD